MLATSREPPQTTITGYFLQERPMADIAADLGVITARVSQLCAEALSLLKDGLNTHLNPRFAPVRLNPESVVARRRASYYGAIAARTGVRGRLDMTKADGHTPFGRGLATTAA